MKPYLLLAGVVIPVGLLVSALTLGLGLYLTGEGSISEIGKALVLPSLAILAFAEVVALPLGIFLSKLVGALW